MRKTEPLSKKNTFPIFFKFFILLIIILGLLITASNIFVSFREKNVNWQEVQGEIVSVSYKKYGGGGYKTGRFPYYYIMVKYHYIYNENNYSNSAHIERHTVIEEIETRLNTVYSIGSPINILVDPNNPSYSRLPFEFRTFGESEQSEFSQRMLRDEVNSY